jgi:hypothetical protein
MIIGTHIHGPFNLSDADRRRHIYILGSTGTGKSALLLNMLADDFSRGRGVAFFDPHGETAREVLRLVPPARVKDVVYINPADLERPVAYNPLYGIAPDRRATAADNIIEALQHHWADSWGPRMEHILRNCLLTLLDTPGSTLLCVPRLLNDDLYRKRTVKNAQSPVVRAYWRDEFSAYGRQLAEYTGPILNKFGRIMSSPYLRNILSQPRSTIDLRQLMDERRILIANLSKGSIGGDAGLLGGLLITGIAQAALARTGSEPVFGLIADEFQTFADQSFETILSEARKFGLVLTLANQYVGQLPNRIRQAVFGNAATVLAFRIGAEDSDLIAKHLGWNPDDLINLKNHTLRGRFLVDGSPSNAELIDTLPPPTEQDNRSKQIIDHSRTRFGRPRAQVEERIERFLSRE